MPVDGRFIRAVYLEELQVVRGLLRERLIPCLGNVSEKIDEVANSEASRLWRSATEWTDPGDISEQAYDNAVAFGQTMAGLQEGLKAISVAILFHLFEQHLQDLCRITWTEVHPRASYSQRIEALGLAGFDRSEDLHNLSLIANTAKHGDGPSATALRGRCPDLFAEGLWPEGLLTLRPVLRAPLLGEGLYITLDHFDFYADLVERFWGWVAEAKA
jgi:hypothetical protein